MNYYSININQNQVPLMGPRYLSGRRAGGASIMNLLAYTSKDDYIKKDLRRRFDNARDITEVIDIIELTRYFQFHVLAKQMITDLHEEERRMWRRHCKRRDE
jgi:hypothetical protein